MKSLRRLFVCWVALGALLLASCDSTETRTQLTFQITASPALQSRLGSLSVVVRVDGRGDQNQTFQQSQLTNLWPVEIVVIPEGSNNSTYQVTLTATAFDTTRTQIASVTKQAFFRPRHADPVLVPLDNLAVDGGMADAAPEPGVDASNPPGKGDAGENPPPGNDGGEPTVDAGGGDAGGGAVTCQSDTTIKCDDGNPCNGTEKCDPSSSASGDNGCVKGADVVACSTGSVCDRTTGMCSTCLVNADGDKDGVKSVSCGGMDCDDADDTVAPGKPELCDGKDNDCDGTIDGVAADPACAPLAPTGGTDTCIAAHCVQHCNDPTYSPIMNVCTAPATNCPANACAPGGTCNPLTGGAYTCTCATGYRSGLDKMRCVKQGSTVTLGFETTCDATVDSFGGTAAPSATISAMLYAACGVASILEGPVGTSPSPATLVRPAAPIAGATGATALASTVAAMATSSVLTLTFSPLVGTVAFDVLGINEPAALTVTAVSAGAATPAPAPVVTGTAAHFAIALPNISSVTITYAPVTAPDTPQFYVDQLNFTVPGCGDKLTDMAAGEACDDANAVQCDGCDNGCQVSTATSAGCGP